MTAMLRVATQLRRVPSPDAARPRPLWNHCLAAGLLAAALAPPGVAAQTAASTPATPVVDAQADVPAPPAPDAATAGTAMPPPAADLASADAPGVPPEAVAAVARTLNCPICQGYSLQDCPLEVCAQMRGEIAAQLAAGRTADEVRAAFVADYGPQVLNAPPTRGFYLAAWLAPVAALMLGAVAVVVLARRSSAAAALRPRSASPRSPAGSAPDPGTPAGPAASPSAPDYAARLDALAAQDDR